MIKCGAMKEPHYEIERKYLIERPDPRWLEAHAEGSEITQTYLLAEPGTTERVRKRGKNGVFHFTHTVKRRVSDLRKREDEEEISEERYLELLRRADPERNVIRKTRWCFRYQEHLFELDVFPFWDDRAYLEIELTDEEEAFALPPDIRVIREVSGDGRYTNAALSRRIPFEDWERKEE